jgi:hypothetical protein
MSRNVVVKEKLEQLLLAHWTSFVDRITLMRRVLEDARDGDYKVLEAKEPLQPQTKITLTRFAKISKSDFEVWVEFTVPREDSIVQGTHVYHTDFEDFKLAQTYGVWFVTKNQKPTN